MMEIAKDGNVLARHITVEDFCDGLNFYSLDNESIQVGAWAYGEGKELAAHIHNEVPRTFTRTCEALYVVSGSLEATIYDLEGKKIEDFVVHTGEILILLECGHGYRILEDDTKVVEIKNGPYPGAEVDRRRI